MPATPMLAAAPRAATLLRPSALGAYLRRGPVSPTAVAALLGAGDGYASFRRIVRQIFPEAEAEILAVGGTTVADRETERCWAFVRRVDAEFFPCFEFEEYDQVACGIPFLRFGWGYDSFHDLDLPLGKLLLFALCEQPYASDLGTRIPLLDAVAAALPAELVARIPREGVHPTILHARLDGGRFAAAAEFADWLWSATGTIFLDADQEADICDAEWTREVVLELAQQWRTAAAIMDRVKALEAWLEADPPRHFTDLIEAALGAESQAADHSNQNYSNQRRPHVNENTEHALAAGRGGDGCRGGHDIGEAAA